MYICVYGEIRDWKNPIKCKKINGKGYKPKHRQQIHQNVGDYIVVDIGGNR